MAANKKSTTGSRKKTGGSRSGPAKGKSGSGVTKKSEGATPPEEAESPQEDSAEAVTPGESDTVSGQDMTGKPRDSGGARTDIDEETTVEAAQDSAGSEDPADPADVSSEGPDAVATSAEADQDPVRHGTDTGGSPGDDVPGSDFAAGTSAPPASETAHTEDQHPVHVRSGPGLWPLVLVGAFAAAIGTAATYFLLPAAGPAPEAVQFRDTVEARFARQANALNELEARIPDDGNDADLGPLREQQDALKAQVSDLGRRLDEIRVSTQGLRERITALEDRPAGATAPSSEGLTELRERIAALQAEIATQREEVATLAEEQAAEEERERQSANSALRRAALTRVQTALDTGSSFDPALADLEATGQDVPPGLADVAESGVASLSDLRESFPPAARSALAAARGAGGEGTGQGFMALLREQLGARSLEPREGSDADAILSRAEAALQEGRLNDALAEIEMLPEAGRAELSGWVARARARLDAVAAAEKLASDLN